MKRSMEKVLWLLKKLSFKGSIIVMLWFKDVKETLMVFIGDNLSMEFEKDMVLLNGIMEKFSRGNGEMVLKTGTVFGNHQKVIFMKVNGSSIDSMEREYSNID